MTIPLTPNISTALTNASTLIASALNVLSSADSHIVLQNVDTVASVTVPDTNSVPFSFTVFFTLANESFTI